ncbi:hypothetical protein [Treponema phagedenis]|uniref:hypothetical protein n=1 Tax=Treponema phagedenis TaxID=162 RepID=UPI000467AD14|nr:hypothetical protein [Treponema phagedenis]QEJ95569.1 hypothetical protein FUT79_10380 [Treponema phagedenis]QEK01422.1 hypothetical protein FUT84_09850 [Treponema phagedenis]QEK06441.1 hypothetical protein FUT80_06780 [Treponema phagedenis]
MNNITNYKKIVTERNHHKDLLHFSQYTKVLWINIFKAHLKKANCLVNDLNVLPNIDTAKKFSQQIIYNNQLRKFVQPYNCVAILSAFPFFIVEYFTKERIQKEGLL